MEFVLKDISDIKEVAPKFLEAVGNNKHFAFYGEMAAGKTTFIKGLLEALSITEHTSSPTFSIVNEYSSVTHGKIYHFDFYRIEDPLEVLDIGVEEIFEENAYCFMEWPGKIDNFLPEDSVSVYIEVINGVRKIKIEI